MPWRVMFYPANLLRNIGHANLVTNPINIRLNTSHRRLRSTAPRPG